MERTTASPSDLNSHSITYAPCLDINGTYIPHLSYYTPPGKPCTECHCFNGHSRGVCIMLTCPEPTCPKFEQVPGTCCNYKCQNAHDFPDRTTIAIVVSLTIVLLFTLIAIIFVFRKIMQKRNYGKRLSCTSLASQIQQPEETDIDDIITRNSIPNNLRPQPSSMHTQGIVSSCSYNGYSNRIKNLEKPTNLEPRSDIITLTNNLRPHSSEPSCSSLCDKDIEDSDSSLSSDESSSAPVPLHAIKLKYLEDSSPFLRSPYTPLSKPPFI